MTQALSLLSPLQIKVTSNNVLIKLFDKFLEMLVNAGWILIIYGDRAQTVCEDTLRNKKIIEVVHIIKDQLDDFYMKILNQLHFYLK